MKSWFMHRTWNELNIGIIMIQTWIIDDFFKNNIVEKTIGKIAQFILIAIGKKDIYSISLFRIAISKKLLNGREREGKKTWKHIAAPITTPPVPLKRSRKDKFNDTKKKSLMVTQISYNCYKK